MPPKGKKAAQGAKNLVKARQALAADQTTRNFEEELESLTFRLSVAVSQITHLENTLAEKDAAIMSLEARLTKSTQKCVNLQATASSWEVKYRSAYHDLRMRRQAEKRGLTKQEALQEQLDILQSSFDQTSRDSERAVKVLLEKNQNLQSELSKSMSEMAIHIHGWKAELDVSKTKLHSSKKELKNMKRSYQRAVKGKQNAVAIMKVQKEKSVFHLKKKGVFSEETRNLVRLLIKAGCSARYINDVIHGVFRSAGLKAVGNITRTSVARIVREGYYAAQIQLAYEMKKAQSMTFSADGTGHRSINYNSRHVHLLAEDYGSSNSHEQKYVTRFLGIRSSRDGSSKEALADWQKTMADIVDIYNRSPFGKRSGGLLQLVDLLIKLTGMNTDHCAKEKKDAQMLKEMKEKAVNQHLGEEAILNKSSGEIHEIYLKGEADMLKAVGGKKKWDNLASTVQTEKRALMVEKVVADVGKEAFDMLSVHEKQIFHLFIWAGCGCHKDLNTVKGGYMAMSEWWSANGYEGPVPLANRDNDPVIRERDQALDSGDTTTPAQDRAFERTTRGAIKTAQIAGAVFNHKDDKKGHHDVFRWWWFQHVGIPFTFPDTSNNRFQSYCDASAALILHGPQFIKFLENLRDNKKSGDFNHMESNLWKALHCPATKTELAVMAIYGEAVSYPYMKAIRQCQDKQKNALDLGPLHSHVQEHIQKLIDDPSILIGATSSHKTASLYGDEWQNSAVVDKILELIPTLPHFQDVLVTFLKGAAQTWVRFTSEFAPGGLIDEATMEEKLLAWMPATNDENEGALGLFRLLMRRQPHLSLLSHNAMTMFFRNNTEAFMAAKFTEKEDFQYLHMLGRESQKAEKMRRKEIVEFRDQRQAARRAAKELRQQRTKENEIRIAQTLISYNKDIVLALKGQKLKDMLEVYRAAGAPNLTNIKKSDRVGEIRQALSDAIDMYNSGEWEPISDENWTDDDGEDEGEEFDFGNIGDEEDEDE